MFTKVTTDGGMCCSYNMQDIFRDSQYSELLRELQKSDQNDSGSNSHFSTSKHFISSQARRVMKYPEMILLDQEKNKRKYPEKMILDSMNQEKNLIIERKNQKVTP